MNPLLYLRYFAIEFPLPDLAPVSFEPVFQAHCLYKLIGPDAGLRESGDLLAVHRQEPSVNIRPALRAVFRGSKNFK